MEGITNGRTHTWMNGKPKTIYQGSGNIENWIGPADDVIT